MLPIVFMKMWNASGEAFARSDSVAMPRAAIDWFVAPGAMERIPPAFAAMLMGNIGEWRALTTSADPFPELSREAVQSLEVPVLMIGGGRSYPVFRLIDDELERHLRTGRRHIVAEGTHDVCGNQPETCATLIREFLLKLREKQAIFYDDARFLRLSEAVTARHRDR